MLLILLALQVLTTNGAKSLWPIRSANGQQRSAAYRGKLLEANDGEVAEWLGASSLSEPKHSFSDADRRTNLAGQLLAIRLQIRSLGADERALSPTKLLKISEHKQAGKFSKPQHSSNKRWLPTIHGQIEINCKAPGIA